jgi:hypothetical protein
MEKKFMPKAFNINNCVLVKLTAAGRDVEYHSYDITTSEVREGLTKKPDKNGFTRWQLHDLMHTFGKELYNGNPRQMFEKNSIYFERGGIF